MRQLSQDSRNLTGFGGVAARSDWSGMVVVVVWMGGEGDGSEGRYIARSIRL